MANWTILWMVEYMWTRLAEAERARENTPVSRQTRANLHCTGCWSVWARTRA